MSRLFRAALLTTVLLALAAPAAAQSSLTLAWDRNPEPDVTGYVLSWGLRWGEFTSSIDVGNVTQWTVSGLDPDQRYYFSVQAYNADRVHSARSPIVSNNKIISGSVVGTLRDDHPSLFWQHQSTGRLLTWHVSGYDVIETRALSVPAVADTNWKIQATADFNRDGHTDLLWRHSSGGLALWFLYNTTVIQTTMLSFSVPDANWQLRGAGDVDGDGYADLVWQHTNGAMAVWLMQNTTVRATQRLTYATSGDWQVRAVVDVDGDLCADLVWQNLSTGGLAVWTLRGSSVLMTRFLSVASVSDPSWLIQGAGDVDGSGRPALIWRHMSSGVVALWYLQGTQVVGTAATNPSLVDDLQWKIVGGR